MTAAVDEVVVAAGWKLKMLLKTKRFYSDAELVGLYKAHLLAYLEYRTPAIYHATKDILQRIDRVQSKLLKDVGIDEGDALLHFSLAPLTTRRDIAMLGVLHRAVIGKGPEHFKDHFKLEGNRKLKDPTTDLKDPLIRRSALGLVPIYNMIPDRCKATQSVKEFQRRLQALVKERLNDGCLDWAMTFSPRKPLMNHPLKQGGL